MNQEVPSKVLNGFEGDFIIMVHNDRDNTMVMRWK